MVEFNCVIGGLTKCTKERTGHNRRRRTVSGFTTKVLDGLLSEKTSFGSSSNESLFLFKGCSRRGKYGVRERVEMVIIRGRTKDEVDVTGVSTRDSEYINVSKVTDLVIRGL